MYFDKFSVVSQACIINIIKYYVYEEIYDSVTAPPPSHIPRRHTFPTPPHPHIPQMLII